MSDSYTYYTVYVEHFPKSSKGVKLFYNLLYRIFVLFPMCVASESAKLFIYLFVYIIGALSP